MDTELQPPPPNMLSVGISDQNEVLVNLDRDRTGHITFSVEQALAFAAVLTKQAYAAKALADRQDDHGQIADHLSDLESQLQEATERQCTCGSDPEGHCEYCARWGSAFKTARKEIATLMLNPKDEA